MDPLYNFGIRAYKAAVKLASHKNNKAKLMVKGQAQTFEHLRQRLDPAGGYIWIHSSSLGEFEQARPLIEMIKTRNPEARIVLSFFSPSGYEVRKNYDLADAVCYLPFDLIHNVKRFLDIVKPSVAIFVKYEFWGNYLMELHRRHIPTYIISSIFRDGQIFFRPWGGMFRKMLRCFDTLFVQDEESRQLLADINITNVVVAGDTRFDRVVTVRDSAREFPLIQEFASNAKFTLVMGSSWQPDEDIVIPYFNAHPDMKLIIAPHEFDKERLLSIMGRIDRKTVLYTHAHKGQMASCDCLIINTFGLLSSLYRYGQVAYIGGGFGSGIHNINEAAVYGMPVIFGPNYHKFREAHELIACEGGFTISDAEQFATIMDKFVSSTEELQRCGNIAANYIQSHLGATQRIYTSIFGASTE
ncbi:MAG: 3-deoxy-D-manno-octulosonic acid transferase [Muribaculaceae bacterium]|nr:3-deoxy-D-manno-octulosonic acid transferase [Muribaculaceae bacterium]